MSTPSRPELLAAASAAVAPLLDRDRVLVGLAGPPAAGKSTLSLALAAAFRATLGERAAVAVPMDGFHLSNMELSRLGLSERKGAPETFDVAGFVALLRRIRAETDRIVYAPSFNRAVNESIGSDIPVYPETRLVVVEGNYLLLGSGGWEAVRPLLDLAVYIEAPDPVRVGSLLRRQRARGLAEADAHDWVHRSDEANARVIEKTREAADLVLTRRH
jgi:pantothenate kinase